MGIANWLVMGGALLLWILCQYTGDGIVERTVYETQSDRVFGPL